MEYCSSYFLPAETIVEEVLLLKLRRFPVTLLLIAFLAVAIMSISARAEDDYLKVDRVVLDNGLTVLVKERPSGGQAIVQMWVRTGSYNEDDSTAGISHFLEHMVINRGTLSWPSGELVKAVDRIGGEQNGGTYYDFTSYYIQAGNDQLETMLKLIADLCFNPTFGPDQIKEEEPVIEEEIRRADNSASRAVFDRMMQTVFEGTNYSRRVLGSVETVKSIDQAAFQAYHGRVYLPNNMILVVAGDVKPTAVRDMAKAIYGGFPAGTVKAVESPQVNSIAKPVVVMEESSLVDDGEAQAIMVFPVPGLSHEDIPALDLLAEAFGGSSYSVLAKSNASSDIIDHISCAYYDFRYTGLFAIEASGRGDKAKSIAKSLESSAKRVLAQLDNTDVAAARQRLLTKIAFDCETLSGLAERIGYSECLATPNFNSSYMEAVRRLTPADLKAVAKKYINLKGYVLVIYFNRNK